MINAMELDADRNLSGFSIVMSRHGLRHRISETSGKQVVWVAEPVDVDRAKQLYQEFCDGDFDEALTSTRSASTSTDLNGWLLVLQFVRYPVTLSLIIVCVAIGLWTQFGEQLESVTTLTFLQMTNIQGDMLLSMPAGQPWRMITPIFLHFGTLHIAFNLLWLWELGRRIESSQGSLSLILLVFVIGLASNIAQAIAVKGGLFGGMSGVIYGLLGYCWLWNILSPKEEFTLHKGVVFFLLFWLFLGYSGVLTSLGFGAIANTAHASGLVAGLVIAVIFVLLSKAMKLFQR